MYPSNDPLKNVSPEQRARVEAVLQGLGVNAFNVVNPTFGGGFSDQQNYRAWAQWEYSAEEWALFEKVDWGLRGVAFWTFVLLAIVSFLAMWPLLLLAPVLFVLTLLLFMVCMFITMVYTSPMYGDARKRHKARRNKGQPRRVSISATGVWEAGTYFPFNDEGFRVFLQSVKITSDPSILHFSYALGRGSMLRSSNGTTNWARPQTTTLRVLVPRGHEAEAEQLMQRFRTQVIGVPTQVSSPPEPNW